MLLLIKNEQLIFSLVLLIEIIDYDFMSELPPPPPDLENKFHRNRGIVIGLGIGLLLLGLFGLMIADQNYNDVARYVNYGGTRNGDWLFRELTRQIAIFSSVFVIGAFAIFYGWLSVRSKSARQLMISNSPIRNGMIGAGGALVGGSLPSLFMYMLTGDSFQLLISFPILIVGVAVVACSFAVKS